VYYTNERTILYPERELSYAKSTLGAAAVHSNAAVRDAAVVSVREMREGARCLVPDCCLAYAMYT